MLSLPGCSSHEILQSKNGFMSSFSVTAGVAVVYEFTLKKLFNHPNKRMMKNSVAKGRSVYDPALYLGSALELIILLRPPFSGVQLENHLKDDPLNPATYAHDLRFIPSSFPCFKIPAVDIVEVDNLLPKIIVSNQIESPL